MRSRPSDQSVSEFAAALGRISLGPATFMELAGPDRVAFQARASVNTDPAYYDVVVDPNRFWSDDALRAVTEGIRCPVHVAYGDVAIGGAVPEHEIDALQLAGVAVTRTFFARAAHAISPWESRQFHADVLGFLERVGYQ